MCQHGAVHTCWFVWCTNALLLCADCGARSQVSRTPRDVNREPTLKLVVSCARLPHRRRVDLALAAAAPLTRRPVTRRRARRKRTARLPRSVNAKLSLARRVPHSARFRRAAHSACLEPVNARRCSVHRCAACRSRRRRVRWSSALCRPTASANGRLARRSTTTCTRSCPSCGSLKLSTLWRTMSSIW